MFVKNVVKGWRTTKQALQIMSIRRDEIVRGQLTAEQHVVVAVDHAEHAPCAAGIESQNAGHDIVAPVAADEVTVPVVSVPISPWQK